MSMVSPRNVYTGIICVARMNRETAGAIFSFKIKKKHVPSIFTIKIRSGETGETFMKRRTARINPHHEKIRVHLGGIYSNFGLKMKV